MSITLYDGMRDNKPLAQISLIGKKLNVREMAGSDSGRFHIEAMRGQLGADLTDEELYHALPYLANGRINAIPSQGETVAPLSYMRQLEAAVKTRPPSKTYSWREPLPGEAGSW